MTVVDIVAPVRNEEEALPRFIADVDALRLPDGVSLNLLFVEDSSTDGTVELLRRLSADRNDVGYVRLERSYGQGPAVFIGTRISTGDAVVMMDADGSHPVARIPDMIAAFLQGNDIVQGVRQGTPNPAAHRRWASRLFPFAARAVTGVDLAEQNCYFRLMSQAAARHVLAHPRYWRSVRFPLPPSRKFRVAKIDVTSRERVAGQSKYPLLRLLSFATDVMLSLISWPRVIALTAVGIGGAVMVWPYAPVVSALAGVAIAVAVTKFLRIALHRVEDDMIIVERDGIANDG